MHTRTVDIDGDVFVAEWDGPSDHPPYLLIHGLGGHHLNWMRLAPLLAERARVIAFDLRGFGRTPLGPHRTTIAHNVALAERVIAEVVGEPPILAGNSTGGVISILASARARGLVLVDAALPGGTFKVEPVVAASFAATLTPLVADAVTRYRTRNGLERVALETLKLCTVDVRRVPDEVVQAHMAMARERELMAWTQLAFKQLTRSLIPTLLRRTSFLRAVRAVRVPTLMLHGVRDRLVPIAAARAIAQVRPDWEFVQLSDLGHAPQLEDPEAVARPALRLSEALRAT